MAENRWLYDLIKLGLTALIIFGITKTAKRSTIVASLIAALPMTSLLAILWLHYEGGEISKIANLTEGIFWMVIPSLSFFIIFPALLRRSWNFWPSLLLATSFTVGAYYGFFRILSWANVSLPK